MITRTFCACTCRMNSASAPGVGDEHIHFVDGGEAGEGLAGDLAGIGQEYAGASIMQYLALHIRRVNARRTQTAFYIHGVGRQKYCIHKKLTIWS